MTMEQENSEQPRVAGLHLSPLLRKIQHLAAGESILACLRQLAVARGCRHYGRAFAEPAYVPIGLQHLTNEELAVGLCLAHFGH
jgi:hypothetical protein